MSQMRDALHARHYSPRTEKAYCSWARRYIYFHGGQHPAELDERHINEFLKIGRASCMERVYI